VRSTPCGGILPFHPDRGITHYFGVSGYFRPLEDARRAEVRFAAECLAFANVPDEVEVPVHHPLWKAGVQRDAGAGWDLGAGWDFDDVRDFYLGLLFGVDPLQLRRADLERYLELSRAASGEVMAELMGEWRREASPCRGALVLWLKDMAPGAGLGVLDHRGLPKVAYHHLRRALAPVAVWTTDEGVAGVAIHVANDRPDPLRARLRVALYRDLEVRVAQAVQDIEVAPHGSLRRSVEGLLGHFVDAAWAYRFGRPGHDAIVVSLESAGEQARLVSQCFRFPAGRPAGREPAERLGIEVSSHAEAGGVAIVVRSRRLAYGVRVKAPGFAPDDDAFSVEPGSERVLRLVPLGAGGPFSGGSLTALNLDGPVKIPAPPA
jgi:beta-mannosidase